MTAALKRSSRSLFRPVLLLLVMFSLLHPYGLIAYAAPVIPKPKGDIYVQDFENLLSREQILELNQLGRTLEDRTKAQIAVLTVTTLGGYSVEEYALQAFRQYQLGDKQLNNGVLLLLSMEDGEPGNRPLRIEVGYGLEGALPDGKIGRILDQVTIPYLIQNQPSAAILETYKTLYNEVAKEYGVEDQLTPQKVAVPEPARNQSGELPLGWILGIVAFLAIDFIFFRGTFTMLLISVLGRGGGRGGRGGGGGFRGGGGGSSGGGGASRRF